MYSLRKILQNQYQSLTFVFLLPNLMFNHIVTSLSIRRFFLLLLLLQLTSLSRSTRIFKRRTIPTQSILLFLFCYTAELTHSIILAWNTRFFAQVYTYRRFKKKERMQTLNTVVVTNMIRFLSLLLQLLYQIVNNENDQL